jgi:hypothetical protein
MAIVAKRLKTKVPEKDLVSVCVEGYAMVRPLMNARRKGKVGRHYDYINEIPEISAAIYEALKGRGEKP